MKNKERKYLFPLILLLGMLLVLFGWQSKAEAFSGGTGTAANPYQIRTVAEFLELDDQEAYRTAHFKLMADIDMSNQNFNGFYKGTLPGSSSFQGSLDGNGYEIKNLTIGGNNSGHTTNGLFGSIYNNSNAGFVGIKNLTIKKAKMAEVVGYSGFLAGEVSGAYPNYIVQFENIKVLESTLTPNPNAYGYIGGLVGKLEYGSFKGIESDVEISWVSTHYGTVQYFGGVAGYASSSTANDIVNRGNFSYSNTSNFVTLQYVGGLFGNFELSKESITNLTNYGKISVTSIGDMVSIGGVFGAIGNYNSVSSFNNLVNKGDISTINPNTGGYYTKNVGGIFGSGNFKQGNRITNEGDISVYQRYNKNKVENIGGIGGYLTSAQINSFYSDWVNNASITIDAGSYYTPHSYYVGGIVGNLNFGMKEGIVFERMYSSGTLSGSATTLTSDWGGLFGRIEGYRLQYYYPTFRYMYSNMNISKNFNDSSPYYASGLVSFSQYAKLQNMISNVKFIGTSNSYTYSDINSTNPSGTNIYRSTTTGAGYNSYSNTLTTAQLQAFNTYIGLGFSADYWYHGGVNGPYLKKLCGRCR